MRPEGNGIYVQDNIYFGGNINYLQGLSGLDDLREEAKAYDVSLSQYQSVITVDDMGNVKAPLRAVNRKPLLPSEEEISSNTRARSAKLRIAEKTEEGRV